MNSGAVGKDRCYPRSSHGGYHRSNDHVASPSKGENSNKCRCLRGKRYLSTGGLCLSSVVNHRSVSSEQDFNYLSNPERFVELQERSDRFGMRYDGRSHSQYAVSVKHYTSMCKRSLSRNERNSLVPSLQSFKPATNYTCRGSVYLPERRVH